MGDGKRMEIKLLLNMWPGKKTRNITTPKWGNLKSETKGFSTKNTGYQCKKICLNPCYIPLTKLVLRYKSFRVKHEKVSHCFELGKLTLEKVHKGRPRGLVVKSARSATGGSGSDPRRALTHRFSGHAEAVSHITATRKMCNYDIQLSTGALGEKRRIGNRC